ncbi:lipoprotein [Gordonia phage Splinter]|uniref:Uncharacterized protein n=2 Tax=Vendettavirus vendetta TaxID=2049886 RepID=A0A160DD05_9CAUD|nr:lipoprotein [Gordonia phage Vendetta]YP_009275385.1 lipoprotein [Gordonia phage Splinter]ANA85578.1 hypothetical protein PBI_VENDETTA_30 [Gordonia phage Vendetta]ANA85657.1 hypothetical protein PBI_SPLINTER_30 [Gordonia phage Splinter]
MNYRRPLAVVAIAAAAALPLAACSSDVTTAPDPTTTTAAAATTTATVAEVTEPATTTTETTTTRTETPATTTEQPASSGPLTEDELVAALHASGDYTEDQVFSMGVWHNFACALRHQVPEMWNVKGIQQDIRDNYGFTPNKSTAKVLRDSCA